MSQFADATQLATPEQPQPGLLADPYVAYSYSYPHKSAYGPLDPKVPLLPLWQAERENALFLYVHLPFCEMRCGFCNLFARAGADGDQINRYLDVVERQARVLANGQPSVTRLALGGGTPTVLEPPQLDRLFDVLAATFDVEPAAVPTSVETSPKTATLDRLSVLRTRGVRRISIGVQSFVEAEVHAIGRPQANVEVHAALERIRRLEFSVLNIDLIYGQPSQTLTTWLASVRTALQYEPEEVFLYPLYVRPQTGLGQRAQAIPLLASFRLECYRAGRDELLAAGYEQISMRCFRRVGSAAELGPAYCCQTDGMLGLGCGARSYTSRLHYSSRYGVTSRAVQAILERWLEQTDEDLAHATWGIWLHNEERQRRFVIQSLLHREGLGELEFAARFGTLPEQAVPELLLLAEHDLVIRDTNRLRLSPQGLELSDAVGPALYSARCRRALERFTQR